MKLAFIGLGVMGYPMAGFLQKAGHDVTVFNRTSAKALQWVEEYQGKCAQSPKLAAVDADIVFSCVGNDDDLREVIIGEQGALHSMKAGAILCDHTTASADVARELFTLCKDKKVSFLDAPVSGGQAGAENGILTIMIGGEEQVFTQVKPVIEAYARCAERIGDVGAGQLAKMVNQICIAGLVQGLAEGVHFAKQADLDIEKVIGVISKGAAQSWQMENRYQAMIDNEYEFGFAVDWMRKDLSIALNEARNNNASLPVTALVDQFYSEVQGIGGKRWDTSSLHARLVKMKSTE
ncbi:NAD(P)-dependent oxidoreductase [Psychrobium sp. 1_MG-2023]|uniref:NAD(P)-dependent oxidoreductase n=1 Tax=Psychrobium sp. 1_MG-2023 TaxID=3062624 RepID=UPI000C33EDD2|nr:NAD(P)-dependent oxidoreductase [Psychrobium sp. 1_MG-2023]MDP2561695.1 NAD(P)-dependent oxidoreductase [Psychrobium sp. 1_MG-2023]PKF57098.1 oxidoreductase [Alteromonadales bacterium alter-6D02]